ncbi:hypothetical protein EDB81DRAFT_755094 [Dactylonectria macrodidyma]|uniref:Uncharacterized protein n=1 Tax=Dactylonectria macrodidyma TaxID=307937 RepID=A0A9P9JGL3_9HYPO|nr:hypothetical protein EDB81DRAFT_755094 [Dactylonectria macrodidyma]
MSFHLPALINACLVKGQPEGETSRIWDDILHDVFPGRDNYSTGPEILLGHGRVDLFTAHIVIDVQVNERKFLVVECKAPGLETQDKIWEQGVDQLKQYLGSIHGTQRKFGALAVGKCVRFYEWKNHALHDMSGGQVFYLDRQCQSVMQHLVYFRENHG